MLCSNKGLWRNRCKKCVDFHETRWGEPVSLSLWTDLGRSISAGDSACFRSSWAGILHGCIWHRRSAPNLCSEKTRRFLKEGREEAENKQQIQDENNGEAERNPNLFPCFQTGLNVTLYSVSKCVDGLFWELFQRPSSFDLAFLWMKKLFLFSIQQNGASVCVCVCVRAYQVHISCSIWSFSSNASHRTGLTIWKTRPKKTEIWKIKTQTRPFTTPFAQRQIIQIGSDILTSRWLMRGWGWSECFQDLTRNVFHRLRVIWPQRCTHYANKSSGNLHIPRWLGIKHLDIYRNSYGAESVTQE